MRQVDLILAFLLELETLALFMNMLSPIYTRISPLKIFARPHCAILKIKCALNANFYKSAPQSLFYTFLLI